MGDDLETVAGWIADGVRVGRAVLVQAVGSAPFEVGSTLFVAEDGRIAGSVSAGCVEGAAVEAVLGAMRGGYRDRVRYGVTDEHAAEVGLSCGGTIEVLIEPDVPVKLVHLPADEETAIATRLPHGRESGRSSAVIVDRGGVRSGTLGSAALDALLAELAAAALDGDRSGVADLAGCEVFVEVHTPPHLVIVGAGEIAVHLVRLAHAFGFTTVVVDPRSAFLTQERFRGADALLCGWPDELADTAGIGPRAHVVALAHDPKLDDPALVVALRRRARYVGALGGRRSHAARLARLRDTGVSDDELARIHAPVGLDLGAHRPPDIALGILAEIVAKANRVRGRGGATSDSVRREVPSEVVGTAQRVSGLAPCRHGRPPGR